MYYAVGVDIGGTNTRVALVNEKYEIVKRIQFETITENPNHNINKIKEIISYFDYDIKGIGVSCPGPLDLKNGVVLTPPNLPKWHNFNIVNAMKNEMNIPVKLENDANLACLAESLIGAGKNNRIVQFFTISTGIGAGLVIDNKIYNGSRGFANEIANMILWKDGPVLGELKRGSIESISSGTAILKRAIENGLDVENAGDVNNLALEGNINAIQIMNDAKDYLANAISIIFSIIDPDIIILSGSVALKIKGFIDEIEKRVKEKVYDNLKNYVRIVKADLNEDCGLIGAASLNF